ncbi:MAG: PTS system mannose/fructose/sorbose family transporter subunit IID [Lachnospiraceae bacterium]|jgi:PTS system mannose-specific IID component|nr:PTS system mannose/fructose/sorbose family transporter subunit IID [Lachnospiraceae bacterium]
MTLLQAIAIGGFYWFGWSFYGSSWFMGWLSPIMNVFWVGLILGDIPQAMIVGATIQPMYLAFMGAGGNTPVDPIAAGMLCAAVIITGHVDVSVAVALAVPVALIMAQAQTLRRITACIWAHMADKYAEELNTRGIVIAGIVFSNLSKVVLFWLPMTLMLYFGSPFVSSLLNNMPEWLMNGFSVVGGMLPALGMAMTLFVIGRRALLPFFVAGFFLIQYTGLGNIPLLIVALFLSFLFLTFTKDEDGGVTDGFNLGDILKKPKEGDKAAHLLTQKEVNRTFWWWILTQEVNNSFERLQGVSFCISMIPNLKKLYKDNPDELREALKRHLMFFNTQGIWGSVIHGITLALEEQRAMGKDVQPELIINLKAGLMGPFAGIGDTIDGSTFWPILAAFFIPFGLQGHWWAGWAPWIIFTVCTYTYGHFFFNLGYRTGTQAALTILESGVIKKVITFFCVLGLTVLGGLSASFVSVQTPLVIPAAGGAGLGIGVQRQILDMILPGLLSIVTIFGTYTYLRKRNGNVLRASLWLLAIGMVLGCIGILGTPV